jgi:hypothetical protein
VVRELVIFAQVLALLLIFAFALPVTGPAALVRWIVGRRGRRAAGDVA